MRRSHLLSLCLVLAVAGGLFAGTAGRGDRPALGLDLEGGVLVVLEPEHRVGEDVLDQTIAIIRNRVDALGVAEPDIARVGGTVVVQLPGVRDRDRALDLVGQTAELRFRPVLEELPPFDARAAAPAEAAPDAAATTPTTLPGANIPTTSREEDLPDDVVILPELEDGSVVRRLRLGPTELTGASVRTAVARAPQAVGGWSVEVIFTDEGSAQFDDLARAYYQQQIGITLDGVVRSVAQIQQQSFGGRAVISGTGTGFGERTAKDLALVLRFGSLPVQLEQQTVQNVSATLGRDSLRAGVLAGGIGLGLVLLFLIVSYRALGLVVLVGMAVSAMLLYSLVTILSQTSGLALSLAGVTGIIVSIGITADSYIVYFERLKDEVRAGKTLRASVDRGFSRAYRTILTADVSSIIGAGLLYLLTVGPVRGFAFFLLISTALDLVVAYVFTRPAVSLLSRSRVLGEGRWIGASRGLGTLPAGGGR